MPKNRLYTTVLTACFLGMLYIGFQFASITTANIGFCWFKKITGIPCPSCGSTRAVLLFLKGHVIDSLQMNPFGIVIAICMILIPFWIVIDLLSKKESFFTFYNQTEAVLKQRFIAIPLVVLVVLNWIWTIYKKL